MATQKILTGAYVKAEFDEKYWDTRDVEKYAKRLEEAARDFVFFIRDHRSQDVIGAEVVREYGYKCEYCGMVHASPEKPECCVEAIKEWATVEELALWGFE